MKNTLKVSLAIVLFLTTIIANAQTALTQTIKGTVIDKDSKMPLIGANVIITSTSEVMGTSTDLDGNFKITDVPIGRHSIEITYLGYERSSLQSVLLTSGKELSLNVELQEAINQITDKEIVVIAKHDKTKAINELATVSARSFSVEETARYAASLFDPARMASNYAGVTVGGGSDDLFNEIIVRGNSPKGVLWRLEGIEIPNPNHFGAAGNSGGGISMLSSTTLSNSDFYTGAFPSEFGNATSGVFDLSMRKGNNEKREYSFMFGLLGVEAGVEGPFSDSYKGSYLINYRYSTLGLLDKIGFNPAGDILPAYQDLSFKINLPTKRAGTFAIFGLGGRNIADQAAIADTTKWTDPDDDKWTFTEIQTVGTIGVSHKIILSERSYLRTVVAASSDGFEAEHSYLIPRENYKEVLDEVTSFDNKTIRGVMTYTNKLNSKNTFQTGGIFSHQKFSFKAQEYDSDASAWEVFLNNSGKSQLIQAYAHWKHRFDEKWTLNSGFHYTYFALNGSQSLEPRLALKWKRNAKQVWSAAIGWHSKPEHIAFYFVEKTEEGKPRTTPYKNVDMTKSLQMVIGYDQKINDQLQLKIEAYYQYLYDVPIIDEPGSKSSIINTQEIWDILG
ncbi:MAG TPA: TonB-dependent receptor, partial [Phaeodactylibacter sp.]|nr:TonB-dependent receptor [Phaeodactylibacter sp.]